MTGAEPERPRCRRHTTAQAPEAVPRPWPAFSGGSRAQGWRAPLYPPHHRSHLEVEGQHPELVVPAVLNKSSEVLLRYPVARSADGHGTVDHWGSRSLERSRPTSGWDASEAATLHRLDETPRAADLAAVMGTWRLDGAAPPTGEGAHSLTPSRLSGARRRRAAPLCCPLNGSLLANPDDSSPLWAHVFQWA
jgi:hypothetical protein